MCVIESRTYVFSDGTRSTFEYPRFCSHASGKNTCRGTLREYTEVRDASPSQRPSLFRDDAPSPASLDPPTPPTGPVLYQEHRPIERRQSTKEGDRRRSTRYIKPEIILDFSSGGKKKGKAYHRKSLGAVSIGSSNDVHLDSPVSASSYSPIRTGFPEAPVAPPQAPTGYSTVNAFPTAPITSHHRHTSSSSSYSTSGYPPSLYASSEPESLSSNRRRSRINPVSIHNPATTQPVNSQPSSSPAASTASPSPFHTTLVTPSDTTFPTDYRDFHAPAAHNHHAPPPPLPDRVTESELLRRLQLDDQRRKERQDRQRQEEEDRRLAAQLAVEEDRRLAEKLAAEEARQAKIERGRFEERAKQRAENQFAEAEKARAEAREEARRQKARERDAADAREREREREKERERERERDRERAEREKERERTEKKERAEKAARERKERDRLADEVERRRRQTEALRARDARENEQRTTKTSDRTRTSDRDRPRSSDKPKDTKSAKLSREISAREREILLLETQAIMERERAVAEAREREEHAREREEHAAELRRLQQTSEYWDPRGGNRFGIPNTSEPTSGRSRRDSFSARQPPPPPPPPAVSGLGHSASRRGPAPAIHQPQPPLAPLNTNGYAARPTAGQQQPFSPLSSPRSQPAGSLNRPETMRERGERVIAEEQARAEAEERTRQRSRELREAQGLRDEDETEEDLIAGFGPRLGLGRRGTLGGGRRRGGV